MFRNSIAGQTAEAIGGAARKLFFSRENLVTVLLTFLLFLLLIGALFLFVTTREGSLLQVLLGLVIYPVLAILLFLLLQALALSATRIGVGPIYKLRRAFGDSLKLLPASLPLLLIVFAILRGLGLLEAELSLRYDAAESHAERWRLGFNAVRWCWTAMVSLVIPLLAIHWWMTAIRGGAMSVIRAPRRLLRQAFAPGSILIYALIVGTFGGFSWLAFFTRLKLGGDPQGGGEWLELYTFASRVGVGMILIFLGWLLLLGSISEWMTRRELSDLGPPTE